MALDIKQTKKLIKAKKTLNMGFSERALYTILDTYSKNIQFNPEKHTLYTEYPFKIESSVGVQDLVKKNVFHFVSLWISSPHRVIINEGNTGLAERIFLYMGLLYNNQHR
jgi:hypothetical protein